MQRLDINENQPIQSLVGAILTGCSDGETVQILTPPRRGRPLVQRVRSKMARTRLNMRKKGKPVARFTLKSEVFPWTLENGTHYDSVLFTIVRTDKHKLLESLDDIIGGDVE